MPTSMTQVEDIERGKCRKIGDGIIAVKSADALWPVSLARACVCRFTRKGARRDTFCHNVQ